VSLSCRCCVLPGRGLCDGLITRPEEFYRVCMHVCVCVCVWVWSWNLDSDEVWPTEGSSYHGKKVILRESYGTRYIFYQEAISGWNSTVMKCLRYVRHRVIKIKINCVPSFLSPSNCCTHVNIIVILL